MRTGARCTAPTGTTYRDRDSDHGTEHQRMCQICAEAWGRGRPTQRVGVTGRRPRGTPQRACHRPCCQEQGASPRCRAKTGGAQRRGCGARMCERGAEGVSGPRRRTARQSDRGSPGAKPPCSCNECVGVFVWVCSVYVYVYVVWGCRKGVQHPLTWGAGASACG